MEARRGTGDTVPPILISVLDGSELASRLGRFIRGEKALQTHRIGG